MSGRALACDRRIHRLRVDSRRNSACGSASLEELDFDEWWTDDSFGRFYLHVKHKDGERVHRVSCRKSDTPRLAYRRGVLYWLVSDETKETT